MDLHFAFLYSAVQKIGEWGTQPPSGFLPLDSFAGMSLIFPRFWKAGGVSLSAESDEGSRPLRYEFALQTHLDQKLWMTSPEAC